MGPRRTASLSPLSASETAAVKVVSERRIGVIAPSLTVTPSSSSHTSRRKIIFCARIHKKKVFNTELLLFLIMNITIITIISTFTTGSIGFFYCHAWRSSSSLSFASRRIAAFQLPHSRIPISITPNAITTISDTTAASFNTSLRPLSHSRRKYYDTTTQRIGFASSTTIPTSTTLHAAFHPTSLPLSAVAAVGLSNNSNNPMLLLFTYMSSCTILHPLFHKVVLVLSTLTATIAGGIFSGSLHAVSGPDHLAALVPRCVGLPWHRAMRIGAVWGVGHGASATILGLAGFAIRRGLLGSSYLSRWLGSGGSGVVGDGQRFDLLHHAGSFMELAIGISLIVIGLVGLKEAREWHPSEGDESVINMEGTGDDDDDDDVVVNTASINVTTSPTKKKGTAKTTKRAVLFNGMLHGFSWDGAPSLAPAVAISSFTGSLTFLLSYAVGTTAAMGLATALIGEGTRRAAGKFERPNLPRDLGVWSSLVAMGVGIVWCFLALR